MPYMDYFQIFYLVIFAYGVSFLYQSLLCAVKKTLFAPKLLFSSSFPLDACRDPEKFTAFVLPRAIVIGVLLVGFGILAYLQPFGEGAGAVYLLIIVGILALFVVTAQQAKKRFWDET